MATVKTNDDALEATRVLVALLAQANTLLKKKKAIEMKQSPPPSRQLRPPAWAVEFKRQLLAMLDEAIKKQHK